MKKLQFLAAILALAAVAAQPARAQDSDEVAKLTSLVVKALPIGEMFGTFIERDPSWPMGDKASRVEAGQLACLRQRLSPAGFREQRQGEVAAFARRYPEKVGDSVRVLEAGAADMFGASIRMGADEARTGKKADYANLAANFTPQQMIAFVEISGEDKHRQLRELIGIGDSIGIDRSKEQNTTNGRRQGMAIGMKLMLGAMDYCKVPLSVVQ